MGLALALDDQWYAATARAKQHPPPGEWRVWFLMTGRGWGKTRVLSEWVHQQALEDPGSVGFLAGRTMPDAKRVLLHHPRSGLLATMKVRNPCESVETKNLVVWKNGSRAQFFSSEEPDSARGPEHGWGIADEVGTWKAIRDFAGNTLWTNLLFGLRGGAKPKMAVATTPRLTSPIVRELAAMAENPASGVVMTTGSMLENEGNLPRSFVEDILRRYEGTHLGPQEIEGKLLKAIEGQLVHYGAWGRCAENAPQDRIVVGVDPSGSAEGDEAGVVACGRKGDRLSVLADWTTRARPELWGARAVELFHALAADLIVAEANYGGDMVRAVIQAIDNTVPVKLANAARGKHVRFEPLALRYQRGQVDHVPGLEALEDQMCSFTAMKYEGPDSPGRADAAVWCHAELFMTGASWDDLYGSAEAAEEVRRGMA